MSRPGDVSRLKPGYGPTLAELLGPRWRRASVLARGLFLAGLVVVLAACLVVIALEFLGHSYSQGGAVPFSFRYGDLQETAPERGGYVKLVHYVGGRLEDSLAVRPLQIGPYQGSTQSELLISANAYIQRLERQVPGFELYGQGRTGATIHGDGYQVLYFTTIAGRRMFGRNILLLPDSPGVRKGLLITMLSSPRADAEVVSPLEVASTGVLAEPLHSLAFR